MQIKLFILLTTILFNTTLAISAPNITKERIISLAPSITEILFALELGDKVVGVTAYCDYPKDVKNISKIGGFSNPNIETILTLKPTIIFGLPEHSKILDSISRFNVNTKICKQNSIASIISAINLVAKNFGKEEVAKKLINTINSKVNKIKDSTKKNKTPSVLVTVGGHVKSGSLEAIYGAGQLSFYNELIKIAGGKNVLNSNIEYTKITAEGVLTLNPDIIIDLIPFDPSSTLQYKKMIKTQALKAWNSMPKLNSVKNKQVYIFSDEFIINPGPRIVKTLELFANAINKG